MCDPKYTSPNSAYRPTNSIDSGKISFESVRHTTLWKIPRTIVLGVPSCEPCPALGVEILDVLISLRVSILLRNPVLRFSSSSARLFSIGRRRNHGPPTRRTILPWINLAIVNFRRGSTGTGERDLDRSSAHNYMCAHRCYLALEYTSRNSTHLVRSLPGSQLLLLDN